ncbi:MAG: hypothetical protein IJM90_08185 [Firmicutes bacterium]|nr:hypothetical protein [Bacillota bacterium]
MIDYFEHPMLSEPAVRIIGFYQDEVYSVHVMIFNQKDYAAFKEELQREAEELLPKEWLESGDYFIIKGNAGTSWSDPVKNQLNIDTVKEEYLNLEEDNVMADITMNRWVDREFGPSGLR